MTWLTERSIGAGPPVIIQLSGCSTSTRIRIRCVFKKFHSGERFQTFAVLEFAFSSDTCGWNVYQQNIFAQGAEKYDCVL